MSNLEEINQLIKAAAEKVGSEYVLAKTLDVPQGNISRWKKGGSCPPTDIALMAHIAEYDPVEWLVRATVEKVEKAEKRRKLEIALGKYSAAIGAAIASSSVNAETLVNCSKSVGHFIRCILLFSFKRKYHHITAT